MEFLQSHANLVQKFLAKADGKTLTEINEIILRLDRRLADFDPHCSVFAKLVEYKYATTVLAFCENPEYCRRFMDVLVPLISNDNPVLAVKIALRGFKFSSLANLVPPASLLQSIGLCVQAKELELAADASMRLVFSADVIRANAKIADRLAQYLTEFELPSERSLICLTRMPYVLFGDFALSDGQIAIVTELMRSGMGIEAIRALTLGAALAQNKNVAKTMATAAKLEAVAKFFKSVGPPHFLYVATRVFLAFAPFLKLDPAGQGAVKGAVEGLIAMALANEENARLAHVVAQAVVLLPRGSNWDMIIRESQVQRFWEFANATFPDNPGIKETTKLLQMRFQQ
jgi:hypothetical protein